MAAVLTTGKDRPAIPGAQSVIRAISVLNLFRDAPGDLGVAEVSRQLGLTLSTAHRLVQALLAADYLAQNRETERYSLGRSAFLLGQAAQSKLGLDLVTPVLEQLSAQTGESVNLGLLDHEGLVVAARVESKEALRFSQPPGTRVALYATSMGKAVLAFNESLATEYVDRAEDAGFERLTENTICTATDLRADLEDVRRRGWSVDNAESIAGVRCVAAPILDAEGRAHAAIAVQAPGVRMADMRLAEFGPLVVRAANQISALLEPRR